MAEPEQQDRQNLPASRRAADVYLPRPAPEVALERLAQATNSDEIVLWTQVRGELVRQDREAAQQEHEQWKERAEFTEKRNLSLATLVIGVGLVVGSIQIPALFIPGMFMLGVGSYRLAPRFVMQYFKRRGGPDAS